MCRRAWMRTLRAYIPTVYAFLTRSVLYMYILLTREYERKQIFTIAELIHAPLNVNVSGDMLQ